MFDGVCQRGGDSGRNCSSSSGSSRSSSNGSSSNSSKKVKLDATNNQPAIDQPTNLSSPATTKTIAIYQYQYRPEEATLVCIFVVLWLNDSPLLWCRRQNDQIDTARFPIGLVGLWVMEEGCGSGDRGGRSRGEMSGCQRVLKGVMKGCDLGREGHGGIC